MRVAPILTTPAHKPNFKGFLVKTEDDYHNEYSQETTVHTVRYDYYPFANESEEDIKKVVDKFQYSKLDLKQYPEWNELDESWVHVKPHLSITLDNYKKAKLI